MASRPARGRCRDGDVARHSRHRLASRRPCALGQRGTDGTTVYSANFTAGTVSVIDTSSDRVTATVTVGGSRHGIAAAVAPDAAPGLLARQLAGHPGRGVRPGGQVTVGVGLAGSGVLLLTFPAHLFNLTFEENYEDFRDRWRRPRPCLRPRPGVARQLPRDPDGHPDRCLRTGGDVRALPPPAAPAAPAPPPRPARWPADRCGLRPDLPGGRLPARLPLRRRRDGGVHRRAGPRPEVPGRNADLGDRADARLARLVRLGTAQHARCSGGCIATAGPGR